MGRREFIYSFLVDGRQDVRVALEPPVDRSDHLQRIIKQFRIPCFLTDDLEEKFNAFVDQMETEEYSAKIKSRFADIDRETVESLAESLSGMYQNNWQEYHVAPNNGQPKPAEFEDKFGTILQTKLDHVIRYENELVVELDRLYTQIAAELDHVSQNFAREMAYIHQDYDGEDIILQTRLLAEVEESWQQRIDSKKQKQRELYCSYVDDLSLGRATHNPAEIVNTPEDLPQYMDDSFTTSSDPSHMFSNNIRLVASLPINFSIKLNSGGNIYIPKRVATLLSLSSNRLNGLLVLTDCFASPTWSLPKDLMRAADHYCDFHFPDTRAQMREALGRTPNSPGSVLVTKHSNLDQIHVVFHLLCCPRELSAPSLPIGNLTSEAIKNVVQFCSRHNILQLTIPLFLTDPPHLADDWCCERADFVLKVVRGALYDLSASRVNITFLIPQSTSPGSFDLITSLISDIYKQKSLVLDKN